MRQHRGFWTLFSHRGMGAAVLFLALLALLLLACGGPEPTPQILVITATFTPQSQVQVVTATYTPQTRVQVVTATFTPAPEGGDVLLPSPTTGAAVQPVQPAATDVLVLPTAPPTEPPTVAPTAPPTAPPTVAPTAAPTAKPTTKPVSLASYFVVYTNYQGPDLQNYSLWGMNGDGSEAFKIEGAGQASEPVFAPDGNQFAFYHWLDGIYVWNLNKQTSAHIVHNGEASFPTWAPKANRLAYANLYGQPWIHIVNLDGSDDHKLTPGLRPSWSLNGGFIAYDTCENNKCGIYRINPDGGGKRQLTSDAGGGAAVSPNGKQIAYWSREDGDFEIFVVNADGSGRKQLTKNSGNDALPAWSPDGLYIYYLSDQNGKGWAVMAMSANGANPRNIHAANAGNDPRRGWQYQRLSLIHI